MSTTTMNGAVWKSGTLTNGNAVIIPMADAPFRCSVWTVPAGGDTVTISYSMDNGTTYTAWPQGTSGAVTVTSSDTLIGAITHLKVQRTAGAGTTSTYGVTQ